MKTPALPEGKTSAREQGDSKVPASFLGTNNPRHLRVIQAGRVRPMPREHLDAERKAFATIAAKLALAGFSLHQLAHGGYLVSRWDRTFHSNDLAGVRGFCQRAGVAV